MIEKSVNTLEEAKAKYEELVVKLKRLETLDDTLKKDIQQYKDKITNINNEIMTKFDKIDNHKDFLKKDQQRMGILLGVLKQNKENYNKLLTTLVLKKRTKNAQLEDNDIFKRLRDYEKKMQSNENQIFSLENYIDSKSNDNQYSGLLKECVSLQQQINDELLKKYK